MRVYKLRHEIKYIPETESGIYWFKLRFPNAYSLGLSEEITEDGAESIVDIISRFSQIVQVFNTSGFLSNKRKALLLSIYKVQVEVNSLGSHKQKIREIIGSLDVKGLKNIVELIRIAVGELPPVYVGITEKQSFRERFYQHFYGNSGVLEGLTSLGINWDWVNFVTCASDQYDIDRTKNIEDVFHFLLKPILSKG